MYQNYLNDDPVVMPTVETAAPSMPTEMLSPGQRDWRQKPRKFSPRRMSFNRPQSQQPQGAQFYDHQMAMAAEQNARNQQRATVPATPEASGIGGISWPVIALIGGGFLLMMMVMMSGKK